MRTRILIYILLSLILQSCFVYENTISWEDASNVKYYGDGVPEPPNYLDTARFNLRLKLERTNQMFILPFLFVDVHRKKPIYNPVLRMNSKDQSITKFFDFRLELLALDSIVFFSEHYADTVKLNVFNDYQYNAKQFVYCFDYIPKLKEKKDSILINYHLKVMDLNGKVHEIEGKNIPYIRTHYKKFGSFL